MGEIRGLKIAPAVQSRHFSEPARGEAWYAGRHAGVLFIVAENATFSESAESMKVFPRQSLVVRVESELIIGGSVEADPLKGAQPVAGRGGEGQFQVRRCGIHLPLRIEHADTQGDK